MKRLLMTIVLLGITSASWAQAPSTTPAAGDDARRLYVGAVGGVTFGNTTGSTFGVEAGYKFGDAWEVFGEAGRMSDVTSSGTEGAAAQIGNYLGTLGRGAATWSVESPANYGAIGLRYLFPLTAGFEPYVAVSLGGANVERKSTFALNGADVTATLPALGVQLGEDLAGRTNNALVTLGGGVRKPIGAVMLDLGVRYGRIFTDPGTDTFRLSIGAGYRF